MSTIIVPPEFYGIAGLGKGLGDVAGHLVERKEKEKREKKEKEALDREDKRYTQEREDRLDMLAIDKANAIMKISPGLEGRQRAMMVMGSRNIVPSDSRLTPTLQELIDENTRTAITTLADERTPEQNALIAPIFNLRAGETVEGAVQKEKMELEKMGLTLQDLRDNADKQKQYRDALRAMGLNEGSVQAKLAKLGIQQAQADIGLTGAKTAESLASASRLKMEMNQKSDEVRHLIAQNYIEVFSKYGMAPGLAYKTVSGGQLTPEEQTAVGTVLQQAAAAAKTSGDPAQKLNALVAATKAGISLGDAQTTLMAASLNDLFGKQVATVTQKPGGLFSGPKAVLEIDQKAAIGAIGGDASLLDQIKTEIAAAKGKPDELAAILSTVKGMSGALPPLIMQELEKAIEEGGGSLAAPAGTTPAPAAAQAVEIAKSIQPAPVGKTYETTINKEVDDAIAKHEKLSARSGAAPGTLNKLETKLEGRIKYFESQLNRSVRQPEKDRTELQSRLDATRKALERVKAAK